MPDPTKKNPMKRTPKNAPKHAPNDAPKGKPAPQDEGEQCETNDANPSSGPRKPKCHEGYPEKQPTDKEAGE